VPLDNWVLKQACQDAKGWIEKGHAGVRVAINVSAVQFEQDDLAEIVSSVLAEGVETEEQLAFLTMKLCPEIQGYIFSSPLPITKAIQLMQKQTPA